MEELGNKIGNFLRIAVGVYILFCLFMLSYFMITQQEIPDDGCFLSLSAHIGVIILMIIFIKNNNNQRKIK